MPVRPHSRRWRAGNTRWSKAQPARNTFCRSAPSFPPSFSKAAPENAGDVARTGYLARRPDRSYIVLLRGDRAQLRLGLGGRPASAHGHRHFRSDAIPPVGTLDERVAREHGSERLAQARERDIDRVAVAKRVVLGAAPHVAVQILDAHAGGAGAREVLEDLPLLGRKGQLAVLPAYATAIELQGEIEMRGRILACVEDPRSSTLLGEARRRPVESQPRDPGCERPDRSGRLGADGHAGAGAGAPERLVPELGNRPRPGSAELCRARLEVARSLCDEGANQVRASQHREIAVPFRHGRATRDRGDRFAGPAQPGPGLAPHELHAGELVERTGAAVPGFRARGGGSGLCQIAALERAFRGAQPRIRMRCPESAAWRRSVPGVERPRLDPRQRQPPGAGKRPPASLRRLAALPARLAKQSEIHLARRPQDAEPGLGGNPGGDADELLGALELAETDCASGEVVRDTGAEDPIRAPIERAECGLSDLHRLLHLAAPEEDPRPEEDRRSLGKAAVVAGRPAAGLAGGDLRRPVDLIESHQG